MGCSKRTIGLRGWTFGWNGAGVDRWRRTSLKTGVCCSQDRTRSIASGTGMPIRQVCAAIQ